MRSAHLSQQRHGSRPGRCPQSVQQKHHGCTCGHNYSGCNHEQLHRRYDVLIRVASGNDGSAVPTTRHLPPPPPPHAYNPLNAVLRTDLCSDTPLPLSGSIGVLRLQNSHHILPLSRHLGRELIIAPAYYSTAKWGFAFNSGGKNYEQKGGKNPPHTQKQANIWETQLCACQISL